MVNHRHPGYEFIEGYPHGLPTCPKSLARCSIAYCDYLRNASGLKSSVPVDVDAIMAFFGIRVMCDDGTLTKLMVDGLASPALGIVYVQDDDLDTRQRFTKAHELLEYLVDAIDQDGYDPDLRQYFRGQKKEKLCNWGASQLLYPSKTFLVDLRQIGVSLSSASTLAEKYETSLLSTLITLVQRSPEQMHALFVWKKGETVPGRRHLSVKSRPFLRGDRRILPAYELKIDWCALPKHLKKIVFRLLQTSITDTSILHSVYEDGVPRLQREYVSLAELRGEFLVDAKANTIGGERHVVSLMQLSEEYAPAPASTRQAQDI